MGQDVPDTQPSPGTDADLSGEQRPGPCFWHAVLRVYGHGRVPEHTPLTSGLRFAAASAHRRG